MARRRLWGCQSCCPGDESHLAVIPSVQQIKDWTHPEPEPEPEPIWIFIVVLFLYLLLTCSKTNLAFGLNKPESIFNKHINKHVN